MSSGPNQLGFSPTDVDNCKISTIPSALSNECLHVELYVSALQLFRALLLKKEGSSFNRLMAKRSYLNQPLGGSCAFFESAPCVRNPPVQ